MTNNPQDALRKALDRVIDAAENLHAEGGINGWSALESAIEDARALSAQIAAAQPADSQPSDEVERDASRYRYMRNNAVFEDRNGPGLYWYLPRFMSGSAAERLDEVIDADIAASAGKEKP